MSKQVAEIGVILYLFGTALVWAISVYYMFRVVVLRKDGINIWRDTGGNPFNLVFMPYKLTPEGRKARKNLFIFTCLFIALVIIPLIFNSLT